jgi:monomeric isocitrate dehydrogenase
MNLPIVFRLEAQAEFDEAFDWYEQKQLGLGVDFLVCVAEVLERIGAMPESYPMIFQDVRRAIVHKFPYLVL